ncbi:MAG: hypothetical protein EOO96_19050, partial [Pedobacter sp.]
SIDYKVSFLNTYHAVIIGYLANLALPRFGEVGRCSIIHKTEKVPMFASIGTVITERLFDVLVLFITASVMLTFQYDIVSGFLHDAIYVNLISKISAVNYFWLTGIVALLIIFIVILRMFLKLRLLLFLALALEIINPANT